MKNKCIRFGILALVSVFGMLIAGCALLTEIFNPTPPPTDDGLGGIVNVRVTNSESYWWVGYTGDDDGAGFYINRNEPTPVYAISYALPYQQTFRNDTKYTIHYRQIRQNETNADSQAMAGREDKRLWRKKTVYISNDETVTITIP